MKSIMFLCHGNICRSPMAEFIMKKMVEERNLSENFEIASAAVSAEEIGNPVYPPARKELASHGISCEGHAAHRITPSEFDAYDLVIVMDRSNLRWLSRIVGEQKASDSEKVHMLMEFDGYRKGKSVPINKGSAADVADPWYTGDFRITWNDIVSGCRGLLDYLAD